MTAGKLAYGALFTVALPAGLVLWARCLDAFLPLAVPEAPWLGALLATLGVICMALAIAALWHTGHGLPMSPYPPEHFVTTGVYGVVAHPIYLGAVLLALGCSLAARSPGGLWIVTPVLAASIAAWVVGFEASATRTRFGARSVPPALCLPPATSEAPTAWDRASVVALLLLPWLVAYEAIEWLGVPPDAITTWQRWDASWPVLPWTEAIYALPYVAVLLLPFVAATRRDLRWFMQRGWLAIALIIPLYLLLPLVAAAKPVVGGGLFAGMMRLERLGDEPVTAFPAFHVVWTVLAAIVYTQRWPRLGVLSGVLTVAVSISCVTTGMHSVVDVVAGLLAALTVVRSDRLWEGMRRVAERIANGWHEWTFGPVRCINHGLFAAAGSVTGLFLMIVLAGVEQRWALVGLSAASVVGAALWAQVVEGSSQLLRPYGYYGSVVGTILGVGVAALIGADAWLLWAAFAIGGALAQAIGRGRCLVQGCCHGAECAEWLGIHYHHPRSRVTRLSALGGRPLHPTQLYSAGWMLLVTVVLLRLWWLAAGLQFIVGLYFVLTGLGRFVEEHFRGEPQTAVWYGFRLYQWLALASLLFGAVLTATGWSAAPAASWPPGDTLWLVIAFGGVTYLAYGVDFPRLNRRFSRLV